MVVVLVAKCAMVVPRIRDSTPLGGDEDSHGARFGRAYSQTIVCRIAKSDCRVSLFVCAPRRIAPEAVVSAP